MQEKEWKDFREDAVVKATKRNVNEYEIFCLWVLYQLEMKEVYDITDYKKTILLAAGMTEESPDFGDDDESFVEYCLDELEEKGLIKKADSMPFIKQLPNDIIKGTLTYVH